MIKETELDETSSFITESSEMPEVTPATQEEATEEPASSEVVESEVVEESAKEEAQDTEDKKNDSPADNTSEESTEPKKASRAQKRIDKRIDKVIREREDVKRQNEKLQKKLNELEGKKPDTQVKEPIESDFETYDKYLDALDKFDSSKEAAEPAKVTPEQNKEEGETSPLTDSQKTALAVIGESLDSNENKPSDFDKVALNPSVDITNEMLEALAECEDPAKVMYHLGMNKEEATSIANKSPAQQMREIVKLDMTVKVTPPKPIKTTNASEPISPVQGSDQQTKSLEDMSYSEYEAAQNAKAMKNGKSNW